MTGLDAEDGWRHAWYVLAAIVMLIGIFALIFLRDRPGQAAGAPTSKGAWPIAAYKSRLVWHVTFLAFCAGWCFGLYTTFFGVYLEEEGISVALRGRLWMLLGLLSIGSGVFWGSASDKLGRPAAFLSSFVVYGTGCLIFWLAPVLAGLGVSVILVGLSFRAAYTICAAAAGDYVDPRYSAAAFGLMGVGAGLGQAVGPLIGGTYRRHYRVYTLGLCPRYGRRRRSRVFLRMVATASYRPLTSVPSHVPLAVMFIAIADPPES